MYLAILCINYSHMKSETANCINCFQSWCIGPEKITEGKLPKWKKKTNKKTQCCNSNKKLVFL